MRAIIARDASVDYREQERRKRIREYAEKVAAGEPIGAARLRLHKEAGR
jgi:hypothetical protein